jgi:predicted RNA binding protein YcfA (HicA-like mRNA interferase family)
MPKLKRVSGEDVIRVLEKLGFIRVRQRGSHVVLRGTGDRHLAQHSAPG